MQWIVIMFNTTIEPAPRPRPALATALGMDSTPMPTFILTIFKKAAAELKTEVILQELGWLEKSLSISYDTDCSL